ncbi:unnamed protein product [Absidia cylindrospora]
MEMEMNESVLTFGDRLIKAMNEGEVEDCQALAYCFLRCLPNEVANAVGAAWASQTQTTTLTFPTRVHQLVDITRTITLPMDVKRQQRARQTDLKNNRFSRNEFKTSNAGKPCFYCNKPWSPGHRCPQHDKAKGITKARALNRARKTCINKNHILSK